MKKIRRIDTSGKSQFQLGWTLFGFAFVLIVWQALVSLTDIGRMIPGPLHVLKLFFVSFVQPIGRYTIPRQALWSLARALVGYSVGSILGILIGVTMGISETGKAVIKPLFEVLRPIPPIAWIPLAILWMGIGEVTKYFIIAIGTFTQLTLNTYAGVANVDPELIGAAQMLGAGRVDIIRRIIFPSATPQIFAGLQSAVTSSWMAVLAAEMVRSSEGLGWVIIAGSDSGNITQTIVGMIAIGIVGYIMATVVRLIEGRVCRWQRTGV